MQTKFHILATIVLGCVAASLCGCGVLSMGGMGSVCPDCKGDANRSICSTCWGEGYRVDEKKVSFERCPTCLGTGQNKTMHRPVVNEALAQFISICPSCSGRGQKEKITVVRVFCQRCQGSGKGVTKVICARCEGSGEWRGVFRSGKNRKGWIPAPSPLLILRSPEN